MNALALQPTARPTLAEPIPSIAAMPGLKLLKSATARALVQLATLERADELTIVCRAALRSMTPATTLELAIVLEALALHYPVMRRTEAEAVIVNGQWADDLEGWPLDLIQEAARLWRNSAAQWFPTPGQFKAQCAAILTARTALASRAAAYLAEIGVER